jgi:hypothetical protein
MIAQRAASTPEWVMPNISALRRAYNRTHVLTMIGGASDMTYNNRKRLIAAALLLYLIFAMANYYLNLGVLPKFAGLMVLVGVLLVLVYISRFGATRKGIEEIRRGTGGKQQ